MKKPVMLLGLMSGTSLDAIDVSLLRVGKTEDELLQHTSFAYPTKLREEILALLRKPSLTLPVFTRLHYEVGEAFAMAAEYALKTATAKRLLKPSAPLLAIGSHG